MTEEALGTAPTGSQGSSAEALVMAGREALDGGKATEAYELFSRAIKADRKCAAAFMGRGQASGRRSTVNDMLFSEMLVDFLDASRVSTVENREEVQSRSAFLLESVAEELWIECVERFQKHAAVDACWSEFVAQGKEILFASELAWRFRRRDEVLLRKMLAISKEFLQGFPYSTEDGIAGVRRLGREDESVFKEWKEKTTYRIRRLDPDYETPES